MVPRAVPLRLVQDVLGHSSNRSTEIYAHLPPGATETVVDALDGMRGSADTGRGTAGPLATSTPAVQPVRLEDLSDDDRARLAREMMARFGLSVTGPASATPPVADLVAGNSPAMEK